MTNCLSDYWPEYLIEAPGLRAFMISAFVFTVLLMHPGSPVTLWIGDPVWKRAAIGIAMSLTAIGSSTLCGTHGRVRLGNEHASRPSVRICVASSCTAERERSAFSDVATSRPDTQSDAETGNQPKEEILGDGQERNFADLEDRL